MAYFKGIQRINSIFVKIYNSFNALGVHEILIISINGEIGKEDY